MSELNTLIMILKMCGILGMQGDLKPSDAFNCKQAEKFVVEYHFNGNYKMYQDYMTYEIQRDWSEK